MRRIVGATFLTLDGVMQGPGGPTEDTTGGFRFSGWLPPVGDDAIEDKIGELFGRPFDLLLGRRTYDIFAAYWPYAPDEMAEIRDPFDRCTKYVLTHDDHALPWRNSERVADLDALRAIKQGDGPDIVIQGSSTLYPQLLDAGLIDELTLMISPVVLGQGKRLFGEGTPPKTLKMTSHRVSDGGNIIATYQPAGPVEIGTYVTTPPSEREEKRQEAMAEGSLVSGSGLTLYVHPFSSFSWKALIPLWADETPFTYRNVDLSEPGVMDELRALWPLGKFPVLVDEGRVIAEASCIIEHLAAYHPTSNRWIPDGEDGRRVRFLDRFFDLHIQGNMQPTVNHAIWPDGEGLAAARGRDALRIAYDWLEKNLPGDGWAVGDSFTLADCAAAPALFYSDWIEPIGPDRPRLAAYRARLLAHQAVSRAIEEARPYRHYFPLGAPDRD